MMFEIERPEMERVWILQEEERKKRIPRRILLLFIILVVSSSLITVLVKKAVPPSHHHRQPPPPPSANYSDALQKALRFFDVQRSGKLPHGTNISWRGDSCLHDGDYRQSQFDLVGGFYDDGGATKSTSSLSFSLTLLSWTVLEYGAKYESGGQLEHVKKLIKWGTDYVLKAFDTTADTVTQLVLQVGSPKDQYCWIRPEEIHYQRREILCWDHCSQVAADMAAALASASIIFKDDTNYSRELIQGAKILYQYAESRKFTQMQIDELIWGSTWLYYATGELAYLDRATSHGLADRVGSSFVFSWEDKLLGSQLLLTRMRVFLGPGYPYEDVLSSYHRQTNRAMCSFLPDFETFRRTKGGLIQLNHGDPHPLQYAANAAFLAALYVDYLETERIPGWTCGSSFYRAELLREFAVSQVDYILGKNPQNMSYLVGFGDRYPKHVHHRGASIPNDEKPSCTGGWMWRDTIEDDPNVIEGAMVAGPDKHDGFEDVRSMSNFTEPSLAGNAGLVAALVAVSSYGSLDRNGIFYAVAPLYPVTPPLPAAWTP